MKICVRKGDVRYFLIVGDCDIGANMHLIIYKVVTEDIDTKGYVMLEDNGEDFEEGFNIVAASDVDDLF